MLAALSSFGEQGTHELMVQNYKAFVLNSCPVGIVQIETTMPGEILDRSDLLPTLSELRAQEHARHMVLSVIDLAAAQTHLVTDLPESRELLENALDVSFENDRATAPRIMMRKTDLVPSLSAHLEDFHQGR
jgi:inorganic pyrophosphatase/exopolyphosphatase